ncbi:hypothetical protein RRG08_010345 [Elysia crispata]|uniref:Uncharacterized protein n=1 Tax=Elysia crispata TaxID=231223 RepID=A0AAE1B195_9GAST|nr:hypothetical protein RRG08_010345 [Elysia crispata]
MAISGQKRWTVDSDKPIKSTSFPDIESERVNKMRSFSATSVVGVNICCIVNVVAQKEITRIIHQRIQSPDIYTVLILTLVLRTHYIQFYRDMV